MQSVEMEIVVLFPKGNSLCLSAVLHWYPQRQERPLVLIPGFSESITFASKTVSSTPVLERVRFVSLTEPSTSRSSPASWDVYHLSMGLEICSWAKENSRWRCLDSRFQFVELYWKLILTVIRIWITTHLTSNCCKLNQLLGGCE